MGTPEVGRNSHGIILKPVVTEKSSILMDEDKYTFEVDPCADKTETKVAIEAIFRVEVGQVAIQNHRGEIYRARTGQGRREGVRRAIVALHEGTIDIFGDQA